MAYLKTLTLKDFRSYSDLHLDDIPAKNIVLSGANGAGKTNILEAISLFAPGRGLRHSKVIDMQRHGADPNSGWIVSSEISTLYDDVRIGTARDTHKDRRLIKINGQIAKAQSQLHEWLSCLWLTPQMDRLFLDDKSARRRFFDRLVFTFDPGHMGRLTRYENAMRQRLKLLKEGQFDPNWLQALESQMAETALSICAARRDFCTKLQNAYVSATEEEKSNFPSATLDIKGDLERLLETKSALAAEDHYKEKLLGQRRADGENGTTRFGPHRSDFDVLYQEKNMPAAQSSTGEQKALLIGIILAHARLLKEERGAAPILLLDEVVAHLDPNRRAVLAFILNSYSSQVWMSGTDKSLFEAFKEYSVFYEVSDSTLSDLT